MKTDNLQNSDIQCTLCEHASTADESQYHSAHICNMLAYNKPPSQTPQHHTRSYRLHFVSRLFVPHHDHVLAERTTVK